jgi:hypothetical protein
VDNNIFRNLKQIVTREGVKGLYRGFVTSAIGKRGVELIYYPAFEIARQHLTFLDEYTGSNNGLFCWIHSLYTYNSIQML